MFANQNIAQGNFGAIPPHLEHNDRYPVQPSRVSRAVLSQAIYRKFGVRVGELIGFGGFAEVYRGEQTIVEKTQEGYNWLREKSALKVLYPKEDKPMTHWIKSVKREVYMQDKCDHPHIVKLLDSVKDLGPRLDRIFIRLFALSPERIAAAVIRTELLDCDLVEILNARLLTDPELARMTNQLSSAIVYLHSKRIVHSDIKPENVLLIDQGGRPLSDQSSLETAIFKLGDFGLARTYPVQSLEMAKEWRGAGTQSYLSPEKSLANRCYHCHFNPYSDDVFAFGKTVVVSKVGPSALDEDNENMHQVWDNFHDLNPPCRQYEQLYDTIGRMLLPQRDRISMQMARQDLGLQ